ncbi:hypothetical protein CCP2SC5_850005 [Azospirillaceae bacterium]
MHACRRTHHISHYKIASFPFEKIFPERSSVNDTLTTGALNQRAVAVSILTLSFLFCT